MPGFQLYFELIGAVAFAISGAALAVKKHMDLFGVAMMGMTTAVGGGAVWSAPTFSPSIFTPARPWPARRHVCCCGASERTWRCWQAAR